VLGELDWNCPPQDVFWIKKGTGTKMGSSVVQRTKIGNVFLKKLDFSSNLRIWGFKF